MRLLALLLCAGCLDYGTTHYDVNACTGLTTERCSTLHLTAESALSGAEITQVFLWVHYTSSGVERVVPVSTLMKAPTPFPVAVGLHLPLNLDSGADVYVEALNGPGIVAYQKVHVSPEIGINEDVPVSVNRPAVSGCFDGQFSSSNETDVDCGESCPPCGSNRHCFSGSDCQSAACMYNSSFGTEICN